MLLHPFLVIHNDEQSFRNSRIVETKRGLLRSTLHNSHKKLCPCKTRQPHGIYHTDPLLCFAFRYSRPQAPAAQAQFYDFLIVQKQDSLKTAEPFHPISATFFRPRWGSVPRCPRRPTTITTTTTLLLRRHRLRLKLDTVKA